MDISIIAFLALLLSLAILANTFNNFIVNINILPTKRFSIGNISLFTHGRVVSRIYIYSIFEITTISLCSLYWTLKLIFSLKIRKREKITFIMGKLWNRLLRPVTIVAFITSIYTTIAAHDDADLLQRDIWNFFTRIFNQLQKNNLTTDGKRQEELVEYIEAIQLEFSCCGAASAADWYDVSPFVGYVQDGPYVPFSCITTGEITGQNLQYERIIHPVGCANAVGESIYPIAYPLLTNSARADFLLTLGLLIVSFLDRYLERKSAKSSPHPPSERKYISNSQLLRAIQGTTLFARPDESNVDYAASHKDKIERTYNPDWILMDKKGLNSENISRIYKRRLDIPGQIKNNKFRRLLRSYAPLVEAALYTDGDCRYEVEGNDYYGGFIVTIFRVVCCGLLGLLASHIIVLSFLRKYGDAPKEGDIAKRNLSTISEEEQIETLQEMMFLTSIAVRVCFVIAAIVSKRFRCFLILLGPNLALNAGQSFIAAELTSVAVVGPVRELATNLRAAGETLQCLMELSSNISSDANTMLKPVSKKKLMHVKAAEEDEDDEDEDGRTGNGTLEDSTSASKRKRLKEVTYGEVKSLADFNNFFTRVVKKASRGITKGFTKMLNLTLRMQNELLRDPYAAPEPKTEVPKRGRNVSASETKQIEAANAAVSETFRRHLEKMDTTEKERMRQKNKAFQKNINNALSSLNVDMNATNMINKAIDLGNKIDQNMRDRLLKACMMMKQGKVEQCNKAAVVACDNIQSSAIAATRLPLFFIADLCKRQVAQGNACPTNEAIEHAKKDCSGIGYSLGLLDGFGAQFGVAQAGLKEFAKSFQIGIKMKKIKETAKQIWALRSDTKDALEQLSYMTLDATRGAYAIAFLFSTLMKLLFLLLLVKTQAYITNYLTKMDFDNIYVEGEFEDIDERRRKDGKMYLLPLKKFEKQVVFWKKIGYTKTEWSRSITSLMKSSLLGIGLTFLFVADGYLHDILQVLDIVTQGDIALGGGAKSSDSNGGIRIRGGDGFAAALIKGIVEGFLSLSNIDLNYKLTECAPKVVASSSESKGRFALLWALLFLLGAFSGYLLRLRHIIAGFFYPLAHRKRQMHLYNVMLANRARELSTHKNLLIQRVKEDQLQQEVQELSKPTKISLLASKFATKLMKGKVNCVICHDLQKIGPGIYVCPVDGCATCRQCQQQICDDPKFCVACLDRNEDSIDESLLKLEEMYKERARKHSSIY